MQEFHMSGIGNSQKPAYFHKKKYSKQEKFQHLKGG
jgi:hypothetical protein